MDKAVLEIGAGTGLVSVVASLLGKRFKFSFTYHVNGQVRSQSKNKRQRGVAVLTRRTNIQHIWVTH